MFEAIVGQVQLIHDLGGKTFVFAARDKFSGEDKERLAPAEVHYGDPVGPEALAYAPELLAAMEETQLDCLHLHGIWQGSSLTALRWSRRNPGRTIISPHGMLDPWITGRGRLKKALFRAGVERQNWKQATVFHALTQDEAKDIQRECAQALCKIVPNPAPSVSSPRNALPDPEILYLGRIHTKKNVAGLIEGWSEALPDLPPGSRLTIAGIGTDEDIADCRDLIETSGPTVSFFGPAYGDQKAELLQRVRFLILPSFSEGLPMAILDAWAAGTPTIQTHACHLPEGFEQGAAIECSTEPGGIAAAISKALTIGQSGWIEMSGAAQALAGGQFSSESIARRWADVYARVMQGEHNG